MFDLFRSRDKVVRIMLGGLLVLVCAGMLVYLIPGATPNMGGGGDQVLVEFGKDALTTTEVDRYIQNTIRNQRISSDLLPVMLPQLLEQMINERAVAYEAKRLGIEVSDAELANTLQSIGNGQFNDRNYYQQFVQQQGMSIPEFEDELRRDQLVMKMRNIVYESIVVTPEQAKRAYIEQNQKAKIQYIAFDPNEFKSQIKPSDADLQSWFKANQAMFTVPEKRNVDFVVIDQAKVADTIDVSDAQLHAWYNSHLDQYRVPERVNARHILFKTTGKSPAEVAQIKQKAEDVLKQLRAGANFGDLAKKYSEDTASAPKGGELGWFGRGQMVANFEKATFALKPGQISDLITTEYGFHIIQVEQHEQAHQKSFDEVKNDIASDLKKQTVVDKMEQIADSVETQLTKAPQDAQQIANQNHVTFTHVDDFGSGTAVPGVGTDNTLANAVSGLKKGEVTQPVQVGNDKLVIATVRDVIPSHPANFADVQDKVRTQYIQRKAADMAAEKARQAYAIARANGDMEAAAKATGGTVKPSEEFGRNGAITGVGSAALFGPAFTQPTGTVFGPVSSGQVMVVAKVIAVIPPDMNAFNAQRASLIDELKSTRAQDSYSLFQDSILSRLMQEGKIKVHKDVVDRLMARYRS
ncbi:MAG TPA: peptidyl-prolyl cis-trans isomerase [Bryobacteraceae bacterium]|nr:peptidyl-prolyl cis-trans isomerase [Bryobacteraceae bacterium]